MLFLFLESLISIQGHPSKLLSIIFWHKHKNTVNPNINTCYTIKKKKKLHFQTQNIMYFLTTLD